MDTLKKYTSCFALDEKECNNQSSCIYKNPLCLSRDYWNAHAGYFSNSTHYNYLKTHPDKLTYVMRHQERLITHHLVIRFMENLQFYRNILSSRLVETIVKSYTGISLEQIQTYFETIELGLFVYFIIPTSITITEETLGYVKISDILTVEKIAVYWMDFITVLLNETKKMISDFTAAEIGLITSWLVSGVFNAGTIARVRSIDDIILSMYGLESEDVFVAYICKLIKTRYTYNGVLNENEKDVMKNRINNEC